MNDDAFSNLTVLCITTQLSHQGETRFTNISRFECYIQTTHRLAGMLCNEQIAFSMLILYNCECCYSGMSEIKIAVFS